MTVEKEKNWYFISVNVPDDVDTIVKLVMQSEVTEYAWCGDVKEQLNYY